MEKELKQEDFRFYQCSKNMEKEVEQKYFMFYRCLKNVDNEGSRF